MFRDLSTIAPGEAFPAAIDAALKNSSVLLAIIGPEWLQVKDENGNLRLSNPKDYVRLEILTAMKQKLRVVPVLVGGARMPTPDELPDDLRDQKFAELQCFELSDIRWKYDLGRLVAVIRPTVDPWFRVRWASVALVATIALIVGVLATKRLLFNRQIEDAAQMIENGKADDALKLLQGLEAKSEPGKADPRIYLHEAEVYQSQGDASKQNDAAVKAAGAALARRPPDYRTAGRASTLACDAKKDSELQPEAKRECADAIKYSGLANDDIGHVRAVTAQGNLLRAMNQADASLQAYSDAVDFAVDHKLVPDQYGAFNNLGLALQDQGRLEEAAARFKSAKDGFEKTGLYGEASNSCNNLGTISLSRGDIKTAQAYFAEALTLAEKTKDGARVAQAHVNLGLFYEQTGSLDVAEKEFQTAMDKYVSLGQQEGIGFVNNTFGDWYLQQAKYGEAGDAYKKGLAVTSLQAWSAACLVNLSLQQDPASAKDLLAPIDNAIDKMKKDKDQEALSFGQLIRARVLLARGKTDAAKSDAEEAFTLITGKEPPVSVCKQPENIAGQTGSTREMSDNALAARIILAEIKAIDGCMDPALAELQRLIDSTYHKNVPRNLEARLVRARIMLQHGSAAQRREAKQSLEELRAEARGSGFELWAAKADALLSGKTPQLPQ